MIWLKRNCPEIFFVLLCASLASLMSACSTVKYDDHMRYTVSECSAPLSKDKLSEKMLQAGYLRNSQSKSFMEVFKRPEIVKKNFLAADPFEDLSSDFSVALCIGTDRSYILSEGSGDCKNKGCNLEPQKDIRKVLESLGCKNIEVKTGRSSLWELHHRQDWTRETCRTIAENIEF